MQKSTIVSLVISAAIIGGTLFAVSVANKEPPLGSSDGAQTQNVEVKDGIQYVTIDAKGGYSPRISEVASGLPTKLVMKTDGTYDCSAALVVRSAGFQKILQPTGEEIIDLGMLKSGEKVQGVCGMGMYSFQLKVN